MYGNHDISATPGYSQLTQATVQGDNGVVTYVRGTTHYKPFILQ